MTTTIIGFPRIGQQRELKFATEKYWRKQLTQNELLQVAAQLRKNHWKVQQEAGLDLIPVGDFSFFDNLLDTANLLNIVPKRYKRLGLSPLAEYFAQARGYQQGEVAVKALPMKKWFNTNYHYIVPEFTTDTDIKLVGDKLFAELDEALKQGINAKAVVIGPYTLLKLSRFLEDTTAKNFVPALSAAYAEIIARLDQKKIDWLQIDEPALCLDVTATEKELFKELYTGILTPKHTTKVLLQTYFGDLRDVYQEALTLPFDGIGLDFLEGSYNAELVEKNGFPATKTLFAGVVNGKNVWRNHYVTTLKLLKELTQTIAAPIVINSSTSLLHVPYSAATEEQLPADVRQHLAFATEKLVELKELDALKHDKIGNQQFLEKNDALFANVKHPYNAAVHAQSDHLQPNDYERTPERKERQQLQKEEFKLPLLPTTTIGSFPQTRDVRQNRAKFRKGEITRAQYDKFNEEKIARIVKIQEEIGLDVLVHGEYERNDMVEYFGEKLDGFIFTKNGWVQSYGTRGVKPPIIWGDISRTAPITVAASVFAKNLTAKPVKGMLTGPVTIFNWSFPREDIAPKETVTQIALALQGEVFDLESNGIKIIQIDEPALRENLPLRKSNWNQEYLDWAVPAFRLVHSKVAPTTQIHTHMCYSEFGDIIDAIDQLDADVISFEASRADFTLIDQLAAADFQTEVGPGVYDIHSPRIPAEEEVEALIEQIIKKLPLDRIWINPDCGLKTRSEEESFASLRNIVEATRKVRSSVNETNGAF
ncbi:5-methyltetrahydropteroyltriglutamate--homocysteine S-methyltransferase [Liquorilactobacillus satsumensis]|uniref:5-methyltetrahydropteroyltriglutamate--homocysteine methyltransferase n=1 Tax=Liquorilactobacillus satsumensis DSM 16230 = JCM 12392 TaxID=1423801 RepID=A0A0R1V1W2_9LACO|nr:5-methyltetrahydropteroyltriglutamate--homocysteine S-methyltransferase [Liquorilactobacillus satsumensis]KRL96741.1 5-methyltetrahydropteroyltriglutamate homocysteine S-methyltransferase [Liquorilactobacillus satsumensis DSM 16230 = JCM 12392]MCP9312541.1 5-methyltetrahydropteroyltriglutamate--homocysteine S-methyltransferase [Liquorilactobacillus satsumensis]MCP9328844.1 5-methyltetrahydropteroyltriglutamate--homocysteine S-methyltransferase [Liquorilactobacillus satsumensis]MCP9360495.1 5